jgi:outer membrane lipoprotein-sorting protein
MPIKTLKKKLEKIKSNGKTSFKIKRKSKNRIKLMKKINHQNLTNGKISTLQAKDNNKRTNNNLKKNKNLSQCLKLHLKL